MIAELAGQVCGCTVCRCSKARWAKRMWWGKIRKELEWSSCGGRERLRRHGQLAPTLDYHWKALYWMDILASLQSMRSMSYENQSHRHTQQSREEHVSWVVIAFIPIITQMPKPLKAIWMKWDLSLPPSGKFPLHCMPTLSGHIIPYLSKKKVDKSPPWNPQSSSPNPRRQEARKQ